jgi:hypothetical protein
MADKAKKPSHTSHDDRAATNRRRDEVRPNCGRDPNCHASTGRHSSCDFRYDSSQDGRRDSNRGWPAN